MNGMRQRPRQAAEFWLEQAGQLAWFEPPTRALEGQPPSAHWFADGTLNLSVQCLDRQVAAGRGEHAALIWQPEQGPAQRWTYAQLCQRTERFAAVLRSQGVEAGDRVGIYLGMVPEAVVAMLACVRLGAVHTVIFAGFAAEAVRDRLFDAQAKVLLTQDVAWRRGKPLRLKEIVDAALGDVGCVQSVVVLQRGEGDVPMQARRDHWWHDLERVQSEARVAAVPLPADHPSFILYTSGTTGKPKGIVHSSAGYMLGVHITCRQVFGLQPEDVFWCTADIGWITGHSYVVYGPLSHGATVLLYEGALDYPDAGRCWSIIEQQRVSVFYTAPTAVRAFMAAGDAYPERRDLSSLRLLGSVGEPINPEAWRWYRRLIGGDRCPIVDTWWQTETGAIMLAPLADTERAKAGSCGKPLPGIAAKVLRDDGSEAAVDEEGWLVLQQPWPSMLLGIWGDEQRYREQYWSRFAGCYLTGDGARRDADGDFWVSGRIDDVLNVAGHRLGTAEVESALVAHATVAEAAAVGRPDALRGQALVVFVVLSAAARGDAELAQQLREHVAAQIGRFARPDEVRLVAALPKTRSGKIMRRLLRQIASGEAPQGDLSTLEDVQVITQLNQGGSA